MSARQRNREEATGRYHALWRAISKLTNETLCGSGIWKPPTRTFPTTASAFSNRGRWTEAEKTTKPFAGGPATSPVVYYRIGKVSSHREKGLEPNGKLSGEDGEPHFARRIVSKSLPLQERLRKPVPKNSFWKVEYTARGSGSEKMSISALRTRYPAVKGRSIIPLISINRLQPNAIVIFPLGRMHDLPCLTPRTAIISRQLPTFTCADHHLKTL
jgi:hypothetical protein